MANLGAVVRGPWGGEQAWRPGDRLRETLRETRVPFQPIPTKAPKPM